MATGKKRTSKSPARSAEMDGAKQRKSPTGRPSKQQQQLMQPSPPPQQQQPQQQQQTVVKTERADETPLGVPLTQDASSYIPSSADLSAPSSVQASPSPYHHSHSPPHPRYSPPNPHYSPPNHLPPPPPAFNDRYSPQNPHLNPTQPHPMSRTFPDPSTTFPHNGTPIAPSIPSTTSFPPTTTTHSNGFPPYPPTTSSTTSLTQMTPSLKSEDPHLISALQFLNQNEMLNPQQMSEQFSQYSHYFSNQSQR